MSKNLIRAQELIDQASRHHLDLGDALDAEDDRAATAAHRRLGRCIRGAQRCFRAIADEGMLEDIQANQSLQTSGGMGQGTSDSGGRAAYDFWRRQAELREMAEGSAITTGGGGHDYRRRQIELELLELSGG